MIHVRQVTPQDMPMLRGWAERRGLELHDPLLSPYGFLATADDAPVMAVWAYMILDVPVIQLDHLLSAPGSNMAGIREAWSALSDAVAAWMRELNARSALGYCLIRAFTAPRIAAEAARHGWHHADSPLHCIHYVL